MSKVNEKEQAEKESRVLGQGSEQLLSLSLSLLTIVFISISISAFSGSTGRGRRRRRTLLTTADHRDLWPHLLLLLLLH